MNPQRSDLNHNVSSKGSSAAGRGPRLRCRPAQQRLDQEPGHAAEEQPEALQHQPELHK